MQRAGNLLFDTFFLILIGGAVVTAWQWPFATGLFPLTIGIPVFIVVLCQLIKDIAGAQKGVSSSEAPRQRIRDIEVDRSVPLNLAVRRAASFYLCALGFFALIVLVGFRLAVPLFMLLYLRLFSRAGWVLTLILVSVMTGLVLGVFDSILNVSWPDSLLLGSALRAWPPLPGILNLG